MHESLDTIMVRSALFVDFDNIYLGLHEINAAAAERFASDPARWVGWIEKGMPSVAGMTALGLRQSVLIRRCYLNPDAGFRRFRNDFILAGFSVIDCPSLTKQGKNGADIRMVIDILDMLDHKTHFDEFIILSADSDFTPLLQRLRAHERRTAILALKAAGAYKAACDRPIGAEVFIQYALGMPDRKPLNGTPAKAADPANSLDRVLDMVAKKVYEAASVNGGLGSTGLVRILQEFPEFTFTNNWLGFGSLRHLSGELVRRRPMLALSEADPVRVTVSQPAGPLVAPAPRSDMTVPGTSDTDLQGQIITQLRQIVASSPRPVPMTKAGTHVITTLGRQAKETKWAGAGTLTNLIQQAQLPDVKIFTGPNGVGYLYDPRQFTPPITPEAGPVQPPALASPEQQDNSHQAQVSPAQRDDACRAHTPVPDAFSSLIHKVSESTGVPRLHPTTYAAVFRAIADELGQRPYNANTTPIAVQQRCIRQGEPILRVHVLAIFEGMRYTGLDLERRGGDDALELAKAFRNSVIMNCDRAQLDLSDLEDRLIDDWILGSLR